MSSSEHDQEDVGPTVSSSEPDEERERASISPGSDVASANSPNSVNTRSSVEPPEEAEGSVSSRQSNDSAASENSEVSRNVLIKNLVLKVERDFNDICIDESVFKKAAECYLNRTIDFVTLGIVFSVYREIKMGMYTTSVVRLEQLSEEKASKSRNDIFGGFFDKERKCVCSKCTKLVQASGFAVHLEVCMGIKQSRTSTRHSRRVVTATSTREQTSPNYESMPSSDDDDNNDADWSCGTEKRKRKRDRNTTKKLKSTPTKKTEIEPTDIMELDEVDIEGGPEDVVLEEEEPEEDIFSLSEFFIDDSSQSYATASSSTTRSNTSSEGDAKMPQNSPSPTSSS